MCMPNVQQNSFLNHIVAEQVYLPPNPLCTKGLLLAQEILAEAQPQAHVNTNCANIPKNWARQNPCKKVPFKSQLTSGMCGEGV